MIAFHGAINRGVYRSGLKDLSVVSELELRESV